MSQLPEFLRSFLQILRKLLTKECISTARSISKKKKLITNAYLQTYSTDEKYSTILAESPILMTALHTASSKQKSEFITVRKFSMFIIV